MKRDYLQTGSAFGACIVAIWALGAGCDLVAGIGTYCLEGSDGCPGTTGSGAGGGTTTGSQGSGGSNTGGGSTGGSQPATCGNGKQEAGEECDDENVMDADGCEADCTLPKCGNGIVDPGELCFTAPSEAFPSHGEDALGLVIVDCDADDKLDIIVLNFNESGITALRNDGNATFGEAVVSAGFGAMVSLELSLLGPGIYEVVGLSEASGRTVWFSPEPSGGCEFSFNISPGTASNGTDIVAFDSEGNGNPDVAKSFAGVGGDLGEIFFNIDHDSGFIEKVSAQDTTPTAIAAGNLIGDAAQDLIVTATSQNKLVVLENVGGAFPNFAYYIPQGNLGDQPVDVQVGDLDNDGKLDIVTANFGSGTIAVLYNLGSGTFAAQAPEPGVAGSNGVAAAKPRSVALGDVNQDGFLDAVVANSDDSTGKSSVSVFLNNGKGKLLLATKATFPLVGADAPFEVGRQPRSVKLGDLDGDGMLDIVTANGYAENGMSTVSVLLSDP